MKLMRIKLRRTKSVPVFWATLYIEIDGPTWQSWLEVTFTALSVTWAVHLYNVKKTLLFYLHHWQFHVKNMRDGQSSVVMAVSRVETCV